MTKTTLSIAMLLLLFASTVYAISIEREVTPKTIKRERIDVDVKAKPETNGMVTYTVSHTGEKPCYLIGRLVVKDAKKTYVDSTTTLVTRDKLDAFYFTIPRELIATSTFQLSVAVIIDHNGEAVPMPSVIMNQIKLSEFAPDTPTP